MASLHWPVHTSLAALLPGFCFLSSLRITPPAYLTMHPRNGPHLMASLHWLKYDQITSCPIRRGEPPDGGCRCRRINCLRSPPPAHSSTMKSMS
jgi:hypothetical protein